MKCWNGLDASAGAAPLQKVFVVAKRRTRHWPPGWMHAQGTSHTAGRLPRPVSFKYNLPQVARKGDEQDCMDEEEFSFPTLPSSDSSTIAATRKNPLLEKATVVDRSSSGVESHTAMGAAQSHETEFVRALRPAVIQATTGNRTKVPYEKGYSQMHWVRLAKSGAVNLSGRPPGSKLRTDITLEEVAEHSTDEDGWTILRGKVYNLSPYMKYHPGGQAILRKVLGKDCTQLFNKYHAWVNAEALLGPCQIGTIAVSQNGMN